MPDEELAPLEDAIAPLTEVRSTLLGSSFLALKERGLAAPFLAALPSDLHDAIRFTPAGVWVPVAVAEAHYAACDRLALLDGELLEIGAAVARVTRPTVLAMAAAAARVGEVTPWTILATASRHWARIHRGSGVRVVRLADNEGRLDVLATPLARFNYWRTALRGMIHEIASPFAKAMYVREISCTPDTVAYRLSWL